MNEEQVLREIGLGQSEIKAYIASLEIGSAKNGDIAKKANLNRSNCNEALKRLVGKGLVSSVIKANRKYYEATEPSYLLHLLQERQAKLRQVIPKLEEKRKLVRKEQQANIYEGYRGIKSVFEDILNSTKDEYLVFGAISIPEHFENYMRHWTQRRIEKKIKLKIIYHEEARSMIREYKGKRLTQIRILPKKYFTPAVNNVYGDKTATILWTKEPLAFVVKNKDYADSFRQYFKLLWKIARKA